jgi:hypothetical protein
MTSLRSFGIFPEIGELVRTKIDDLYYFRDFNAFLISFRAFTFSMSGTESSKSKQTISACSFFAFSRNLELFPGTKIRLRKN